MKIKYLFTLIALIGALVSCSNEYPGDSFDFSNSTNPYVDLKVTKIAVSAPSDRDTTFAVTARLRTATFAAPVTVNYELSGALSGTGTITIDRNKLEGTKTGIVVPAGLIPAGQTQVTATLKIVSASSKDVTFDIGRNGTGNTAAITIKKLL